MAEDILHKQFPPYVAKKGEEYMNNKQLKHFRVILETLKDELLQDIERTVHTMQDEATVFADPNDLGFLPVATAAWIKVPVAAGLAAAPVPVYAAALRPSAAIATD